MMYAILVQQTDDTGVGLFGGLLGLVFGLLAVVGLWKIFTKAGQPGWAALIPIYNAIVLLRVVGRPWWWLLLMFIPLVNLIIYIIVAVDLARSFGKGGLFALGLVVLSWIFLAVLGLGSARYEGPAAAAS